MHEAHRCRGDIHLVVGPILPRLALAPDDAGATRCSLRGSTGGHVMVKRRAGGLWARHSSGITWPHLIQLVNEILIEIGSFDMVDRDGCTEATNKGVRT